MTAVLAGASTLILIHRRSHSAARFFAVTTVVAVIAGWGVGQYPWMLVDQLTIDGSAGASATLDALLVVVVLAVVLVVPALIYLLKLSQSGSTSIIASQAARCGSISAPGQLDEGGHRPRDRSRSSK
jgi:cytochrome d ubiquinol oxidase subunit II